MYPVRRNRDYPPVVKGVRWQGLWAVFERLSARVSTTGYQLL